MESSLESLIAVECSIFGILEITLHVLQMYALRKQAMVTLFTAERYVPNESCLYGAVVSPTRPISTWFPSNAVHLRNRSIAQGYRRELQKVLPEKLSMLGGKVEMYAQWCTYAGAATHVSRGVIGTLPSGDVRCRRTCSDILVAANGLRSTVAAPYARANGFANAHAECNSDADNEHGNEDLDPQPLPLVEPRVEVVLHLSETTTTPAVAPSLLLGQVRLHQRLPRRPHLALFVAVH